MGVGVDLVAPMGLGVVLAKHHATTLAPRAGQLMRLAAQA